MTYDSPQALRMALERRLAARSVATGVPLDRLRRRATFERIIVRLQAAAPEAWVLKGGMALEVRLGDDARLTKDIDLGLRDDVSDGEDLHERIVEALRVDSDGDGFVLSAGPPSRMARDDAGDTTWRLGVTARLAGRRSAGSSSTSRHALTSSWPPSC